MMFFDDMVIFWSGDFEYMEWRFWMSMEFICVDVCDNRVWILEVVEEVFGRGGSVVFIEEVVWFVGVGIVIIFCYFFIKWVLLEVVLVKYFDCLC